jgi:hypothetical protein
MEYVTLKPERRSIAVLRVDNGWLIKGNASGDFDSPVLVASTPDILTSIIRAWAAGQVSHADE